MRIILISRTRNKWMRLVDNDIIFTQGLVHARQINLGFFKICTDPSTKCWGISNDFFISQNRILFKKSYFGVLNKMVIEDFVIVRNTCNKDIFFRKIESLGIYSFVKVGVGDSIIVVFNFVIPLDTVAKVF
ncbi:hypothetical protein PI480_01955 [Lactococcus petauri]|nr:hypothetical protein [Lactococcus petauri]